MPKLRPTRGTSTSEFSPQVGVKDKVVMRCAIRGTHKAAFQGIPPTGNKIALSAVAIFRIKDGLVVEEAEDADLLGLYRQLGMELKAKAPAKPAASKAHGGKKGPAKPKASG